MLPDPLRRVPRRLLILSCSQRKTLLPASALDLYDGPVHRQVRAFLARNPIQLWPRVLILSARHGLISQYLCISPYDQVLNARRAGELAALPTETLERTLYAPVYRDRGRSSFDHYGPYDPVFVFGGELYRDVVRSWEADGLFRGATVVYAGGRGIGDMMGQLGCWLETMH